ncbi:ferredoxin--NADP reductase [Pseudomonas sp. AP-1]|uniref:ferredoxin--NADP reductase n=1 Tax=Pseudomonas sp. AP-1 TaxID=3231718 RepID=UPI00102A7049|nr:ferredoxin--NADP reductase [Pseudomonas moorei]
MKQAHSFPITGVVPQGKDGILLSFGIPSEHQEDFIFKPGQYLTLRGGDDEPVWRCYSITSDPQINNGISVLVKRVPGGRLSNWLVDNAKVDGHVELLPPAGSFLLARPDNPVLLYAGGSGIAPIYALARQALEQGSAQVRLFFANRDSDSVMMRVELSRLESDYPGRFEVVFWNDQERGLPTAGDLTRPAEDLREADVYICGPDPFMRAVHNVLEEFGFDRARLIKEDFGAAVQAPIDGVGVDLAQLTVQLNGQAHEITVEKGETLLAAMLRAGLNAPHACRVGECASCTCRLESGQVNRLDSSVLDEDDVEDGWLLACRSFADSEELIVRFL